MNQIGFMQGRLSPIVNGRIQSFPWQNWENEIDEAVRNKFMLMEWTLDQEKLYENPILTKNGQATIIALKKKYCFSIPSLTGDCYMQAPFYKEIDVKVVEELKKDFMNIMDSCWILGIELLVMPLVDNGKLENREHEDKLVDFLLSINSKLLHNNQKVIFECDYNPDEYLRFINRLPNDSFGINYDIGNSASLGISAVEEFSRYGKRILNVHIKDRLKDGITVPLGIGNADFKAVFTELKKINYQGKFILQTARAQDDNHLKVLKEYRDYTLQFIKEYLA